jgi:hypothetical protein
MIVFEDNEFVIHTARKHLIVFALKFIVLIIAALVPLAITPFLTMITSIPFDTLMTYFSFFYVAYLLAMWIWGFMMWTDYYLDITVITNKRIIDMEQKGLFSRETSTMRYEAIQDVTTDIQGVLHTVLNFGNLYIQTAATTKEFVLDDIYDPNLAKEVIVRELSRVLEENKNI